jgi:sterol desaturase/sphingolipid hydroxylase (fatty acid hydroxylase superfamily)
LDTGDFAPWVIPIALGLGVVFDAFVHANLRFDAKQPFWKIWGHVLNTPHFHVWHHNREGPDLFGNYGNVLVVWDHLFGTVITKEHVPPSLGISADQALRNDALSLQLLRSRNTVASASPSARNPSPSAEIQPAE